MYTIDQKEQLKFCFMAQEHRPEKVLTKNICRVRDLEDQNFVSTNDGYVCFFRDNFFSLKLIFNSKKRRTKRLKLCQKKIYI